VRYSPIDKRALEAAKKAAYSALVQYLRAQHA
jgi:hypothetical protein